MRDGGTGQSKQHAGVAADRSETVKARPIPGHPRPLSANAVPALAILITGMTFTALALSAPLTPWGVGIGLLAGLCLAAILWIALWDRRAARQLESLQRERALMAAALDAAEVGVAFCDTEAKTIRLRAVNAALERLLGRDAESLVGTTLTDLVDANEGAQGPQALAEALRDGRHVRRRIRLNAEGGSLPADLTLLPSRDGTGPDPGWILLVEDARERIRTEKAQATQSERYFQAQKTEALGRLSRGVAHDLNNVFGVILGFGSLLRRDLGDQPLGYLDRIIAAGERGKEIVERLAELARRPPDPTDHGPVDLTASVTHIMPLIEAAIPSGSETRFELPEGPATTHGSKDHIEHALLTLCLRARDGLPDAGGRIAITLARRTLHPEGEDLRRFEAAKAGLGIVGRLADGTPAVARGKIAAADFLVLRIADSGAALAEEQLEQLFQPVPTIEDGNFEIPTGLATVQDVVTRHGGAVIVVSRPGDGTEVTLYFPAVDAPAE